MVSLTYPPLSPVITAGGPTGSSSVIPVITWNAFGQLTTVTTASITVPTGANPTASVGLAAVNGSAGTFMRSDGAPPLDQSIAPSWTGNHSWTGTANQTLLTVAGATQSTNNNNIPLINVTHTYAVGVGNGAGPVLKINITNTSGTASNKIVDFQVGTVTQWNVGVDGRVVGSNDWTTAGTLTAGAAQQITWNGRGILTSTATGVVQIGAPAAASPVVQTLQVQNAATGNNNGATTFTQVASLAVGNGTSGDLVFSTGKNGAGSGVLATITEAFRIKGETQTVIVASGKNFQVGNAFVATPQVSTGYIVIYDNTGTAYKVSCNP